MIVFENGQLVYVAPSLQDAVNAQLHCKNEVTIHLPKNYQCDQLIQIVHLQTSPQSGRVQSTRHFIVAEENSQAMITESYHGLDNTVYFNQMITKISLSKNANIHYYKWQQEGDSAFHVASTTCIQRRNSVLGTYHISSGAGVSRERWDYSLRGEGAACESLGFYQTRGRQACDIRSRILHACRPLV